MASSEREFLFNNERFDSEKRYEKLFSKGLSKGKAARVASSSAHQAGKHTQHPRYEKWTTDNLYQKAAELGLCIIDSAPLAEGRIELLHYLKEQSISFEYHRYGSIFEENKCCG